MKQDIYFFVIAFFVIFIFTTCKKDSGITIKPVRVLANNIEGDITFHADTVYVIEGIITLGRNVTIERGTVIKFKPTAGIEMDACCADLIAIGSKESPIVFTSYYDDEYGGDTDGDGGSIKPKTGDWLEFYLHGGQISARLENCKILYGGGFVSTTTMALNVQDCVFAHCKISNSAYSYGALTMNCSLDFKLSNNLFYDNYIPLMIGFGYEIDSTNTFSYKGIKNGLNGIFINSDCGIDGGSIKWLETELPFVIQVDITLKSGERLEFADGVILKFKPGITLTKKSGAILDQNNTDVYFTSYKDDLHGGDTNGDGNDSYPANGDWIGIDDITLGWWGGYHVLYDSH
jgi:hypothetical protein